MEAYNVYYKSNKLNKRPISDKDLKEILERKYIFKIINNNNVKIPIDKLNFVKCIVI